MLNELNRTGADFVRMKAKDHGAIIEMDSKHRSKDHSITLYSKRYQYFHCANP
jgi:hypothetical protein